MRAKGQYRTSTKRCTPLGAISSAPCAIAAQIRSRLDTAPRGRDRYLTVFVDAGQVYAVRDTSLLSARAAPESIVGVYTHAASVGDISDDLAFYAGAMPKAAA